MTHPTPVTVMAAFRLVPDHHATWHQTWQGLARLVQRLPQRHRFQLLQERKYRTQCVVLSEWDDVGVFNRFVRETHLLWLERALGYALQPTEFIVFEDVPQGRGRHEATTIVETVACPQPIPLQPTRARSNYQ